jgi:hypothetical protein
MATSLTDQDIYGFVEEVLKLEGADTNPKLARALFRQCVAEVYRDTEAHYGAWDNDTGGDLTVTGNSCPLPSNCFRPTRVEWDGSDSPLEIVDSIGVLDLEEPGWRDETGTPSRCAITGDAILFNCQPSGTLTGLLVVRGWGAPDEGTVVSLLPDDMQLVPAIYILSKWPVKVSSDDSKYRYERYSAEWQEAQPKFFAAIRDRSMKPFSF